MPLCLSVSHDLRLVLTSRNDAHSENGAFCVCDSQRPPVRPTNLPHKLACTNLPEHKLTWRCCTLRAALARRGQKVSHLSRVTVSSLARSPLHFHSRRRTANIGARIIHSSFILLRSLIHPLSLSPFALSSLTLTRACFANSSRPVVSSVLLRRVLAALPNFRVTVSHTCCVSLSL